ncbi:hypothetical protein BJX64DRAFT_284847 [Aspergillus heterothallicus]
MHFSHATLPLATLLTLLPISLTFADEKADLGYLKCASAVIKTAHFPECTSSYKLDCFCEAAAPPNRQASPSPSSSSIASTTASREWAFQLPPETEDICASFGVARDEIPKYLCDDSAVPVSPRRGSTPMGRVEHPLRQDGEDFDGVEEASSGDEVNQKRAVQPEGIRLLIPENEPIGIPLPAPPAPALEAGDEAESKNHEQEQRQKEDEKGMGEDRELHDADHAVYEIVTVTKTETRCSCAKTTTATATGTETAEAAEETESSPESEEKKTSGALHGTDVAVSTPAPDSKMDVETETETDAGFKPTGASSSVRVASSPVGTAVAPTGVDAEREHHGENQTGAETFQGGAVSMTFSKSVCVLFGLAAGVVLL